MKALTNKSRSFETKQRWIKLARWWALQVIVSICWLKLEYDSSITPRSDTVSDTDICLFSYIPLRKARCVLFYFTIWVWFGQFSSKIVPSIQAANTVLYATTELWKAQNVDSYLIGYLIYWLVLVIHLPKEVFMGARGKNSKEHFLLWLWSCNIVISKLQPLTLWCVATVEAVRA